MQLNEYTAIVDNDFTNHLVDCHLPDQTLVDDLNIILSELGLVAVMHPLVYENELLKGKPRVKLLFDQKVFSKAEFLDIFQDDAGRKAYYIQMVRNLYHTLMGEEFPVSGENVLTYWVRGQSLGEVHSFATCLLCGCGIFLSDDGDAKTLKRNLDRSLIDRVNVYSRQEFMDKFMAESEMKLGRKDRRALTHSSST